MKEPKHEETEFEIPMSDLIRLIKQNKLKIAIGTFAFASLFGTYALLKPVKYLSEATFKEKTNSESMSSSSVANLLVSGLVSEAKSEAKTLMSSKKLLKQVVETLNLQASIEEHYKTPALLRRILDNIAIEKNYYTGLKKYSIPEMDQSLAVDDIKFFGDFSVPLKLTFVDENTYHVFDNKKNKIGSGRVGRPFATKDYNFRITKAEEACCDKKIYNLTLIPLANAIKTLSKTIELKSDKEDPLLLKLSYVNRDRRISSDVLNQLMQSYQNHLRDEQQRIASEQISYLHKREDQVEKRLKAVLDDYAQQRASDFTTLGYADSKLAMDFLGNQYQQFRKKSLMIDLEVQRLEAAIVEKPAVLMDVYLSSDTGPKFLIRLIEEIGKLKQEGDSIELFTRNSSDGNIEKWQASFQDQVSEIENIRQCCSEANLIIALLDKDQLTLPPSRLSANPKYMIKEWNDQLIEIEKRWKSASSAAERQARKGERERFKEQYTAYLTNLTHYLEVRKKTILERLSHQQAPELDFQGINLATGDKLYVSYNKQLSEVENQILQYNFLIQQLEDPEFEISSISSLVTDPIIRELAVGAGTMELAIQDDLNRGAKEKDRMKKDLEIKRRFLNVHFDQTVDLLKLQKSLIKDKIQSLQNAKFELIQQQVSILEKQLFDAMKTHINNLKEEQKFLDKHQITLKNEMATLPKKWASEKIIEQQMATNATMVEEITKLVESKNIAANLEMIQSAPIDHATPPTHPLQPHILLFSILGTILGLIITSSYVIAKAVIRRFPHPK